MDDGFQEYETGAEIRTSSLAEKYAAKQKKRRKKRVFPGKILLILLPVCILLALSLSGLLPGLRHTASLDRGWNLILVNFEYRLPRNYTVELTQLSNGERVDSRMYPALQEMFDDMRAEGVYPIVASGYRSEEEQQMLLEEKIQQYRDQGYSLKKAREAALLRVAEPGTSEHQLGLALDIVDVSYQQLDTEQENTPVQQWLMKNSWKYGFVLRYPTDKSDITGIIYEPWHYRYVGKEAAAEMYENKLCLEEYLGIN